MDYKKYLKWILIGGVVIIFIFITIYCVSITRAENLEDENISSYNLKNLVSFIKQILPYSELVETVNTASLEQMENNQAVSNKTFAINEDNVVLVDNSLNRELLNICLAKAEDEWAQLQKHYADVLVQCLAIDLGLSGGKLFSNEECETQVKPYREKDKQRIQSDKVDCFERYSERE